MSARVLVIGIDCLCPDLVLDRYRGKLPTMARLMDEGLYGPLRSTDPPITVPAWAAMLTGRDPGELGLYGFHKRSSLEPFDGGAIVTSRDVSFPWVWEVAGEGGLESLVVGVPPTWPPRKLRGRLVTDFLTPDTSVSFTWPESLASQVEKLGGGPYLLDVSGHREVGPGALIEEAREMARRRFRLFTRWMEETDPALAVIMEIGLDRMQHSLWHHMDPAHPRYPGPGNDLERAIFEYHLLLDGLISRAVEAAGPDAHVLLVSDHGAQAMMGGVRINEWLRLEGWLVVESGPKGEPPDQIPWGTPLSRCRVDWERSRAFAEGGYCGRVFLNVAGRQKQGCVAPGAFEAELAALAVGLGSIAGPDGRPLGAEVHRPRDLYREVKGYPPDLLVYFGGLAFRALGSIGTVPGEGEISDPASILSRENDTGPDGANHAMDGLMVVREAGVTAPLGRVEGMRIFDVYATILGLLGLRAPEGTLGTSRARG